MSPKLDIILKTNPPINTGESLEGDVNITIKKETVIEVVRIELIGDERTEMVGDARINVRYKGERTIVEMSRTLYHYRPEHIKPFGPTIHSFPFKFDLKNQFPSTFRNFYGRISYSLNAILKTNKEEIVTKMPIEVISIVDLNTYNPHVHYSAEYDSERNVTNICGLSKGKISLNVYTDKRTFIVGETIILRLIINNSSSIKVKYVAAKLVQTTTISFTNPSLKEVIHRDICSRSEELSSVPQYTEKTFTMDLKIPDKMFVPNIRHSNLFKVTYQIHVIAALSRFNPKMEISFKIYLGHIPMKESLMNLSISHRKLNTTGSFRSIN